MFWSARLTDVCLLKQPYAFDPSTLAISLWLLKLVPVDLLVGVNCDIEIPKGLARRFAGP
jgi:hypothetical protein